MVEEAGRSPFRFYHCCSLLTSQLWAQAAYLPLKWDGSSHKAQVLTPWGRQCLGMWHQGWEVGMVSQLAVRAGMEHTEVSQVLSRNLQSMTWSPGSGPSPQKVGVQMSQLPPALSCATPGTCSAHTHSSFSSVFPTRQPWAGLPKRISDHVRCYWKACAFTACWGLSPSLEPVILWSVAIALSALSRSLVSGSSHILEATFDLCTCCSHGLTLSSLLSLPNWCGGAGRAGGWGREWRIFVCFLKLWSFLRINKKILFY